MLQKAKYKVRLKMVPTEAQFAQALKSLEESGRLSNTDKRMLKLHYKSPERKLTPRKMSELMGWGGKTANRRYGDLARRVTKQLNWTPTPQTALRSYYVEGLVLGSREESALQPVRWASRCHTSGWRACQA